MQNPLLHGTKVIFILEHEKNIVSLKNINALMIFFILVMILSPGVFAQQDFATKQEEGNIGTDEQSILNDWSSKMAISINQKMAQQMEVKLLEIIVQAEETRLLDTQTRQFADKSRLGSQPAIGNSEPDFLP